MAVSDCGAYVSRLRRLGAHKLADRISQFAFEALRFAGQYRHLSAVRYRQRADEVLENYATAVRDAVNRYPIILRANEQALHTSSPNRTARVAITLRADQWDLIDNFIARKDFRSRGDYFAYLYRLHRS